MINSSEQTSVCLEIVIFQSVFFKISRIRHTYCYKIKKKMIQLLFVF